MIRLRSWGLRGPDKYERIRLLNQIGFVWDKGERKFNTLLWAIREYQREVGGNVNAIKRGYVIPDRDGFHKQLRGYKLGDTLANLKQTKVYIKGNKQR